MALPLWDTECEAGDEEQQGQIEGVKKKEVSV